MKAEDEPREKTHLDYVAETIREREWWEWCIYAFQLAGCIYLFWEAYR